MLKATPKKQYKFPRRFSRKHCLSKKCANMGFTERASCRPYKNCYKNKMNGGAKTKAVKSRASAKTRKSKNSGNVKPSAKHVNHPGFVYHSESVSYTSHPHGKTPHGKRTIVNISNGVGEKRLEILDKTGKAVKASKQKLNAHEMGELHQGNYVPGLWLSL